MTASNSFNNKHTCNKVFSQSTVLLRNGDAKQAKLPGFIKQRLHQSFFLLIYSVKVGIYFALKKIMAGLCHQLLFFRPFFRDENVLSACFFNEELTAFDCSRFFYCFHSCI